MAVAKVRVPLAQVVRGGALGDGGGAALALVQSSHRNTRKHNTRVLLT